MAISSQGWGRDVGLLIFRSLSEIVDELSVHVINPDDRLACASGINHNLIGKVLAIIEQRNRGISLSLGGKNLVIVDHVISFTPKAPSGAMGGAGR